MNKEKSIKNLGNAIAAISGVIIFSNGGGMIMMNLLNADSTPVDPIFANFNLIGISALSLALGFLISGIFISKYKNWARKMGQIISVLFIIGIWTLMTFMSLTIPILKEKFSIFPYIVALFWSSPLLFLIYYLNKENIKKHFA